MGKLLDLIEAYRSASVMFALWNAKEPSVEAADKAEKYRTKVLAAEERLLAEIRSIFINP